LARHTKYNPVEINASDDRTIDRFLPRVQKAIETQSVYGDRKPDLLIIDEIDGLSQTEGNVIKNFF
jgi:chromosome transmission fidelity protein 18